MSLPGFSAEYGLYKSSAHYRTIAYSTTPPALGQFDVVTQAACGSTAGLEQCLVWNAEAEQVTRCGPDAQIYRASVLPASSCGPGCRHDYDTGGCDCPISTDCPIGSYWNNLAGACVCRRCPSNQRQAGSAQSSAGCSCVTCPQGEIGCGYECVDPSSDPYSCGKCGNICPESATCIQSVCVCPSGQTLSNGFCCPEGYWANSGGGCCPIPQTNCWPTGCTDMNTDNKNCGSCGNVCSGGDTCVGGQCTSPCDTCTNCHFDSYNFCWLWGNCYLCRCNGQSCGLNGSCCTQCPPGQTFCDNWPFSKGCIDILSDNSNCGSCGNSCNTFGINGPKTNCVNGRCVGTGTTTTAPPRPQCPTGQTLCGNRCTGLLCCASGAGDGSTYLCNWTDAAGNDVVVVVVDCVAL